MIFSVVICNCFTLILLKYHSTILYINRNIFIYLNVSLIINLSIMVNEQSISYVLKLFFGSLPYTYALIARTLVMTVSLLYFGIILNLSFFRILLIFRVYFCETPLRLADPTQLQLVGVGVDFVFPWKEGSKNHHLGPSKRNDPTI